MRASLAGALIPHRSALDPISFDLVAPANAGDNYTVGVHVTGLSPALFYRVSLPPGRAQVAWSPWPSDDAPFAPVTRWLTEFSTRDASNTEVTYSGDATSPYAASTAEGARVLFPDVVVTGSASYYFWLPDPVPLDDVGGLSIKLTPSVTEPTPFDSFFAKVAALLHFDEASGSTTPADSGPAGHTFTCTGSAKTDSGQSKFGTTSFLPGTGYASCASASDFQFGAGEFTVEGWVYKTGNFVAGDNCICGVWSAGGYSWFFGVNSSQQLTFYLSTTGSAGTMFHSSTLTVPNTGWSHVAVTRDNFSVVKFWVNGVLAGSVTDNSAIFNSSARFGIGGDGPTGALENFPSWIDEVRVTKGTFRYWIPFTPPAAPFPPGP